MARGTTGRKGGAESLAFEGSAPPPLRPMSVAPASGRAVEIVGPPARMCKNTAAKKVCHVLYTWGAISQTAHLKPRSLFGRRGFLLPGSPRKG